MRFRPVFLVFLLCAVILAGQAVMAADDGFIELIDWVTGPGGQVRGTWEVITSGGEFKMRQTDPSAFVTNAYTQVAQYGSRITYEWTMTFESPLTQQGLESAGLHILAEKQRPSAGEGTGGASYLFFQRGTHLAFFKYEAGNSSPVDSLSFNPVRASEGETHTYRIVIDTKSGLIQFYRDGEFIGDWTDPEPITSGQYIAARTRNAAAVFSQLRMRIED